MKISKNAKIWLSYIDKNGFMPLNADIPEMNCEDRLKAFKELLNKKIIVKRDCAGVAYERA